MRRAAFLAHISLFAVLFVTTYSSAQEDRGKVVVEESYYVVKPENQDKFLQIYRSRIYPFWSEMNKMGLIDGDIRMYSQRVHTLKPLWTFKTVIRFKNYTAIDGWLEKRDEVTNKLFPQAGGYKKIRQEVDLITEEHWDEFIREIPLR